MNIDNQSAYWDRVANQKTFTHPVDFAWLERLLEKQSRILDFGCGYGRVVKQLLEAGYENVTGYDTSGALISRGKAGTDLPIYHIATSEALPVADNSQDCILLFAVLTCIPSNEAQRNLVELLYSKLKPDGIFYISDYYLQASGQETGAYEYLNGDAENFGVFTLPEGAVFRHHTREWIEMLTARFHKVTEKNIDVLTMNGTEAKAFQKILKK